MAGKRAIGTDSDRAGKAGAGVIGIADLQRAGIDGCEPAIAVGAVEDEGAVALLGEAADAGDRAEEGRGDALVDGETAIAQRDGAIAGELAHGLAAILQIEDAGVHDQLAGGRQAAAGAELQGAGFERGATGVAAGAGEGEQAGTGFDEAAAAGDGAGKA